MCRSVLLLLSLLAMLILALPGWCGGGPAGFLVVYDQDDPVSVAVANHYQQVRRIPERCMVPVHMPVALDNATSWMLVEAIRAQVAARGLAGQVQGLALAGWAPLGIGNTSLAVILYNAPNCTDVNTFPYGDATSSINPAFRMPPDTPTICLSGQTPVNGHTFWPMSLVGPTDRVALSPRAAMTAIDQAHAADGAKPDGVVYWPCNSNIRSFCREPEFPQVQPVWEKMGLKYTLLDGIWVKSRGDIVGGVVGTAATDTVQDNRYLPGAWVDHLTSYGGMLQDNWQMPCTDFLLAGTAGSAGTMAEPRADNPKFPHAHIYTHFRNGASLAEAFWESMGMLCEIVPVGDPLMQPYATFPKVTISAPKANATVKGKVSIQVKAAGVAVEPALDLFLDGRLVKIGAAAEPVKAARTAGGFTLDTASLSDGWHELRVVAYAATPVRTQGEAVRLLTVNNHGQAVRLSGPARVNYAAANTFTVSTTNLEGTKLALRANGRELATATAPGVVTVPGSAFPFTGPCTVYALATRMDGTVVSSAPLTVPVEWPGLSAAAAPALGPGVAHLRYFANTAAPGFTWEQASAVEDTLTTAQCQGDRLILTEKIFPSVVPDWTKVDFTKRPVVECTTWFQVPVDDVYEWRLLPGGTLEIDGAVLPTEVNGLLGPLSLQAGWHRLRARLLPDKAQFTLDVMMRGGPIGKINDLPLAWCAAPAAMDTPAPVVTVAAPPPVTGTQVALAAAGAPELTYTWTVVRAPAYGAVLHPDEPAPVTFTPNGTAAAHATTATFKAAGDYLLRVNACSETRRGYADVPVHVTPVLTAVTVEANAATAVLGYSADLYATVADQFGRRMPNAPPVMWRAESPGAFTALSGETARFRPAGAGGPCRITAAAGGKSGALTLTANAVKPPNITPIRCLSDGKHSLTLNAYAGDPQLKWSTGLTYRWTQEAGPALVFAAPDKPATQATVQMSGDYTVKLTVTSSAGLTNSASYTTKVVVKEDGAIVLPPVPFVGYCDTLASLKASFTVTGVTGQPTYAWETSLDNGATWQPLPGVTDASYSFGPVKMEDAARIFRVKVTNEAGTGTSNIAKLTVRDPADGIMGFSQDHYVAPAGATSITLTVRRQGRADGKVVVDFMLFANYPTAPVEKWAKPGEDYTDTKVTLTWEKGDRTDRTITIPLTVKQNATGRGFSARIRITTGDCGYTDQSIYSAMLGQFARIWLASPDEPEGPKETTARK